MQQEEGLDVQPDGSHQLEGIAPSDDTLSQAKVEEHLAVLDPVLEVHIIHGQFPVLCDPCQGEVVGCHDPNGSPLEKAPKHGVGTDFSVVGVRAMQHLVEEK